MHLPAWEKVEEYVRRQIPALFPIVASVDLQFVINQEGASLALRMPRTAHALLAPSPYEELNFEFKIVEGNEVFELSTHSKPLFYSFYLFASAVVEFMLSNGGNATLAITSALEKFGQLLGKKNLLTESEQLGLYGELDFLVALILNKELAPIDTWLGPTTERHDFRMRDLEVEVKATLSSDREHVIHGLDQLVPSPGKKLFLLSLQYEIAGQGAGRSLSALAANIHDLLKESPKEQQVFSEKLANTGYRHQDAVFYQRALQPRTVPMLISVDETFPAITRSGLRNAMSHSLTARIVSVDYRINVAGLGVAEGCELFNAIFPGLRITREISS